MILDNIYDPNKLNNLELLIDQIHYVEITLKKILTADLCSIDYEYGAFINDVKFNKIYVNIHIFNLVLNIITLKCRTVSHIYGYNYMFIIAILMNPYFNNKILMKNFYNFSDHFYLMNYRSNELEFNQELIDFITQNDPYLIHQIIADSIDRMSATMKYLNNSDETINTARNHLLIDFIDKIPFSFWTNYTTTYDGVEIYLTFLNCCFTFEQIYELSLKLNGKFTQIHYQTIKNKYKTQFTKEQFSSLLTAINLSNNQNKIIDQTI